LTQHIFQIAANIGEQLAAADQRIVELEADVLRLRDENAALHRTLQAGILSTGYEVEYMLTADGGLVATVNRCSQGHLDSLKKVRDFFIYHE